VIRRLRDSIERGRHNSINSNSVGGQVACRRGNASSAARISSPLNLPNSTAHTAFTSSSACPRQIAANFSVP
jgi:hypothetical protein